MQILNSKAYYLKNCPNRRKNKIQPRRSLPPVTKTRSQHNDLKQMKSMQKQRHISRHIDDSNSECSLVHWSGSSDIGRGRDSVNLLQRQKQVLKRVIDQKLNESRKKRSHTLSCTNDYVILQKHPLGQINSLEVQAMKPTQRLFHLMNNVRLAQKLLLAKPSDQCSNRNMKKFYHKQNQYRTNITKMAFRSKRQSEIARIKLLNRRKWLD